ncbi:IclR family transcriptional regulator [Actinomadura opuntiae]|uniref:IclR family transcriptional regulator n=1 Tax=Actinomadura sp. OS1-43 TaxID=604315 RepID=UPI00255A7F09|nr:IclR family transcriptional regulator [Actinomadura sp. OS1-43]MDL4813276.1 IclR family transcriptional regulator [Actinomadura sp. OS1-43]
MPDQQHVPEAADGAAAAPARQGIQSVELAMTVLQALEEGLGPMSLTQIAAASAMGPSKAHRYLVSLARVGLVAQSPSTGLYDLGPAMRRLGIESLRRMDEVGLVTEHLPGLRDRTAHAVNLAVWGENGPVIVRWEYGAYALPITVRVGATMPLLTSAVGRAFFAYLPDTLTGPVLQAQLEADEQGVPAQEEIARIKSDVLRDGVAVTSGGVIPGIASLAAPVFTAGDSLPLVVALAMPARVVTEKALADLAAELRRSARTMSEELGASWPPERH